MPKETEIRTIRDACNAAGYSENVISIFESLPEARNMRPLGRVLGAEQSLLVAVVPDDSGSIKDHGNTQVLIDGHNSAVDALRDCNRSSDILYKTQYMKGKMLNNYVPIGSARKMDSSNYAPDEGTPLYDSTIVNLASLVLEKQKLKAAGESSRFGLMMVTDGKDETSGKEAEDVKLILDEMKRKGHLVERLDSKDYAKDSIALLGLSDGRTNFHEVGHSMGIGWVVEAGANKLSEVRRAFNTITKSMSTG